MSRRGLCFWGLGQERRLDDAAGLSSHREDVINFLLGEIEKGLSSVSIAGMLAGISFYGKLF